MSKELFIAAHEQLIEEYLERHPDATDAEAYEATADKADDRYRMSRTAEYKIWKGMIKRCENPNNKDFEEYGARGIAVCQAWRNNFLEFFHSVGARPSPKHSLDRIENDRGYEPGNVRWATAKEQSNNRRPRRWARKP